MTSDQPLSLQTIVLKLILHQIITLVNRTASATVFPVAWIITLVVPRTPCNSPQRGLFSPQKR